ncbi:hypothetical protein N781_15330 [Pontibacillus halophilus JSM 076056 = DSM 19796]|uniref:Uncharacterized protein n=1 Tax=Pontibacillus halophilus JSM 076056 = DSM 19796 TaxID=1385510 RepID=A0A0A5GNE2_9BACI|nr:hypothetical protein [Pontibacillus halophilus]KGX92685.1 hypothetical protein N781_15330 [Pontibacillus halophilus JSM 076056 = DSM 19796]
MGYILLFLIGFGLSVSGGVTLIAYLNFLPAGLGWMDYLLFIKTRPECYLFPIGLVFMSLAMLKIPSDSL